MRVAVVHNRDQASVINVFGAQNREKYNPRTVELVAKALEAGGHTVRVIDGNMHVIEQLHDFMPRVVSGERPGMVFNMAYGIQGVSRYTHLPAMLEMLGVPYVGSGPQAHGLALDKVIAKMIFQSNGLPTPGFWNFASPDDQFNDLKFPVIVKPKMEAVSYGIRVVDNEADLRDAVGEIVGEFKQHVLVEQFIAGREFAIGLLGNGDPEILPIVEIDLEGDPNAIQTASEKLRQPRQKICPADLSNDQAEELRELTRRAFRSLDLFDFARVDLRMDAEGRPYILEINSMASLGRTGTYVHAAQVAGYSHEQLINRMLDVAAVRYFGAEYLSEATPLPGGASRTVDSRERNSSRIRSYLRSQAPTIEATLERLVQVQTPVQEVDRINELGEWLTKQLGQLGFNASTRSRVGTGAIRFFKNYTDGDPDVLLIGHLDTDTPPEQYMSFRMDRTRAYGTGVAECKGGLAIAIMALRALRYIRALRRIRIGVLVTSDDTAGGTAARDVVQELSAGAGRVIGLKAGNVNGAVITSRSGRATYRLRPAFRRSKREISPEQAFNHFCGRVMALQGLSDPDGGIRIGITRMDLRANFGRLPHKVEADLTVRFNDPAAAEDIDERLRRIADSRAVPGVRMEIQGAVRRPPMELTAASEEFARQVQEIAGRLNLPFGTDHRWASSDICFVPSHIPRIDGMGPLGGGARTTDEYILRHSLIDRTVLLALTILSCGGEKEA